MQHTAFSAKLAEQGLLDDRDAVVFGNLEGPDGNGLCLACVNGNVLRLLESDYSQQPGALRHEIPVKDVKILKSSSFVLGPKLVFEYQGARYTLTRFSCAKEFLEIIAQENRA